jgi:hypothetical protein
VLGSICASGAELTSEERTELRQRAERLQAGEARAPAVQGDVKLNQNRSDVRLNQQRSEVKTKTATARKAKGAKTKSTGKKKKRSLKDLPGALVR